MVSNALDNPTTAIAAQISQWKARADEVLESQSSTCKLAELVEWNTSKFARSMECPRVHRAHGESIAATLHRAWNGGRASPVVMTGEWPEFPTSDAVFNTLERCKVRSNDAVSSSVLCLRLSMLNHISQRRLTRCGAFTRFRSRASRIQSEKKKATVQRS
jgi:hypothetical protein